MSLKDILIIERERISRERVVLTSIYERMKNRINNSVRVRAKECVYKIPEFIPGYPLIDITKTMEYLLNKLQKEGFIVIQLSALDLYITWDPVKIRKLNEKLKGIEPEKKIESIGKRTVEKEFERVNEDFISSLIASKRNGRG